MSAMYLVGRDRGLFIRGTEGAGGGRSVSVSTVSGFLESGEGKM